jgi:hypothetical protein
MEVIEKYMINNTVKIAEYKLNQHRLEGTSSNLSIFEVAKLMDALKLADQIKNMQTNSIFHSFSVN